MNSLNIKTEFNKRLEGQIKDLVKAKSFLFCEKNAKKKWCNKVKFSWSLFLDLFYI